LGLVWMNPHSLIEKVEEISGSLYLTIEGATWWRDTETYRAHLYK
jgi:hypothetical protein